MIIRIQKLLRVPFLILCALLVSIGSILGYKYLSENYIAKKQVLGEKEVLTSPSPTISPTPTNTSAPTSKQVTPKPNTPTPIAQKVPVYLPHNNQTVYCKPEGVNAVKDASTDIVNQKNKSEVCLNGVATSTKNCLINPCDSNYSLLINLCQKAYAWGSQEYVNCRNESGITRNMCYDECGKQNSSTTCPSISYDALNSLLAKYCN